MAPRGAAPSPPSFLVQRHFFDDYLAAELRRTTEAASQSFVDLGAEIQSVGADVELYTDYCHLTVAGNRIVGQALARKIQVDIEGRARAPR